MERKKIYERNPSTGVVRWRYEGESHEDYGWPHYGNIEEDVDKQGYTQREVAAMYRRYLASKPNRFTQMIKSGNISGLTSEGGRIGKNFIYDEIKRNARVQGRKELNSIIRGIGGASGIIRRGGSTNDLARYFNQINKKKKNATLVQSVLDSFSDFKKPPVRRII